MAHGGAPCVRRQLDPVHLLGDVHTRLRIAVLSIILKVEISIPLACSNEHLINRAARNRPGSPGLASGLSIEGRHITMPSLARPSRARA